MVMPPTDSAVDRGGARSDTRHGLSTGQPGFPSPTRLPVGLLGVAGACAVVLLFAGMAFAAVPMTRLLDKAQSRGSVTLATGTDSLRSVWLHRGAGTGVASARVWIACQYSNRSGETGSVTRFKLSVRPSTRQELWQRHNDLPCRLTVAFSGHGVLRAALRGY